MDRIFHEYQVTIRVRSAGDSPAVPTSRFPRSAEADRTRRIAFGRTGDGTLRRLHPDGLSLSSVMQLDRPHLRGRRPWIGPASDCLPDRGLFMRCREAALSLFRHTHLNRSNPAARRIVRKFSPKTKFSFGKSMPCMFWSR